MLKSRQSFTTAAKLLWLSIFCSTSIINAQKYCAQNPTDFCVFGQMDNSAGSIIYTVQSSSAGWVGFGLGTTTMPGSDMYVAWTNSTGGVTLSHRIGGDDTAPKLQPNPDFTLLPLQVPVPVQFQNIIKIAFSFKRSLAPSGGSTQSIAASGTTNYLYGIGSSPPNGNPDSPSSSFGIHTSFGVFAADLTFPVANGGTFQSTGSGSTSTPPTLTNIDKLTINLIHGVIMFLAWGVGPYVGIFIARFLKDALGVWWFRLHLGIMLVVTGFGTIIALILEYLYSNGPHFQNSAHKSFGLVITIMTVLQIILGFVSDRLFSMDRKTIPWWDKLHWYLGRFSVLFGIINCHLGLVLFKAPATVISLYWGWIVFGILVLVFGQFKFGSVHHGSLAVDEESIKKNDDSQHSITSPTKSTSGSSMRQLIPKVNSSIKGCMFVGKNAIKRKNSDSPSGFATASTNSSSTPSSSMARSSPHTKSYIKSLENECKFIGQVNPNNLDRLPIASPAYNGTKKEDEVYQDPYQPSSLMNAAAAAVKGSSTSLPRTPHYDSMYSLYGDSSSPVGLQSSTLPSPPKANRPPPPTFPARINTNVNSGGAIDGAVASSPRLLSPPPRSANHHHQAVLSPKNEVDRYFDQSYPVIPKRKKSLVVNPSSGLRSTYLTNDTLTRNNGSGGGGGGILKASTMPRPPPQSMAFNQQQHDYLSTTVGLKSNLGLFAAAAQQQQEDSAPLQPPPMSIMTSNSNNQAPQIPARKYSVTDGTSDIFSSLSTSAPATSAVIQIPQRKKSLRN